MSRRSLHALALRGLLLALLAPSAPGQVFTLTREQLIQYTAQNPFERFPDGRPKVPDAILEKVRGMSSEEVGLARSGYANQFEGNWQILHPGKTLVGRAFTLQFMPARPDVSDVDTAARKAKGLGRIYNQTAIDMLAAGDVLVVDACGSGRYGGIIGDNLAY